MTEMTEYERILENNEHIALATSVDGVPNVRVVNYYPDPLRPNVVYIRTNKNKPKVEEFKETPSVSFTTIVEGSYEYIRVRNAQVERCEDYLEEGIKAAFLKKNPKFLEKMGKEGSAYLYSITFDEASVTVNPTDAALKINFSK